MCESVTSLFYLGVKMETMHDGILPHFCPSMCLPVFGVMHILNFLVLLPQRKILRKVSMWI